MSSIPLNNKPTPELIRYKKLVADLQQKTLDEFDFDAIFEANDVVRDFFEKYNNKEGMKLVDRMTNVMRNLKVLVDFVKSRRQSAQMNEREMHDFQKEVAEVTQMLDTMIQW